MHAGARLRSARRALDDLGSSPSCMRGRSEGLGTRSRLRSCLAKFSKMYHAALRMAMKALFLNRIAGLLVVFYVVMCGYVIVTLHPGNDALETTQRQYWRLNKQASGPKLYLFSLSYMDQITWATKRLQSLQCWVSEWNYNVSVVEPFVFAGAHLGVPIDNEQNLHKTLRFGDIFDIDAWNSGNPGYYPKLVSWHDFEQQAPKTVVIVQIVYNRDYRCTENEYTEEQCSFTLTSKFFNRVLALRKFVVLKRVCINFKWFQSLTKEEFNKLIFHHVPQDLPITVVFNEWRGTPRDVKNIACFIQVTGGHCSPLHSSLTKSKDRIMVPSVKIEDRRRAYVLQYLNAKSGYVAVIIRWEKVVLCDFYQKSWNIFRYCTGTNCVRKIVDYVKSTYLKEGLNATFLSIDVGRYGSSTFNSPQIKVTDFTSYTEHLLRLFNSLSLAEYEQRFEKISETTSPAFVSQLQKAIAANARCLLLVGWGAFQEHTLWLYKQQAKQQPLCYKVIQTC